MKKYLTKNSTMVSVLLAIVIVLGSVKTIWLGNTYGSVLQILALVMLLVLTAFTIWVITLKETPKK